VEPIEKIVQHVPAWKGKKVAYERMSDYFMWNSNYVATADGKKFFVKVPGAGSDIFFNRDHINAACKLAAEVGLGPKVAFYAPLQESAGYAEYRTGAAGVPFYTKDSGVQVDEWLEGYNGLRTDRWIFQHRFEEDFLFKSVDALKKFHNSGKEIPNKDNAFVTVRKLADIAKQYGTFVPREMPYLMNLVDRIEEAVAANGGIKAKPNVANLNDRWTWDFLWNEDTKDMKVVDYEWACMDDVCHDLATMSTSSMLYDDHDEELVKYYFGEVDPFQFARFKLYKFLVCIKGCLVYAILDKFRPAAYDYIRDYAWRMMRLRCLLRDPRTENWVWMVKNHDVYDQWKGYPL
jgi:thiamine kinase-like enzyme